MSDFYKSLLAEATSESKGIVSPAVPSDKVIQAYLSLPSSQEIATIAAAIAPKFENFQPEKLASAALDIKYAAENLLAERREEILRGMLPGDVAFLKNHFKIPESFADSDSEFKMSIDPVRRSIMYWKPNYATYDNPHLTQKMRIDLIKEAVKSELLIYSDYADSPLPEFPYRMEDALRFLTNRQNVEYSVLISSFKELINLSREEVAVIGREIDDLKNTLRSLDNQIKKASHDSDIRDELVLSRKNVHRRFLALICQCAARDTFNRGNKIDLLSKDHIESAFSSYFPNEEYENCEAMLRIIKCGFREFFEDRKSHYLKRDAILKQNQKLASDKFSKEGKRGATKREKTKWESCYKNFLSSNEFTSFAQNKNAHLDTALMYSIIASFAKNYQLLPEKLKPSVDNIGIFFGLTYEAATRRFTEKYIRNQLPTVGFKSLPAETISEFLSALRSRLRIEVDPKSGRKGG